MKKIVTIGEVLVEIMAKEPGHGFRSPIDLIGPFPSGAPAIFIDQVAKLGQPCGIVSCVGDDDFGTLNIERLRADGADVSAIESTSDAVTGSAFVRYRGDGQRDFVFNIKHSACGLIRATPRAEALIDGADHVHVMGSALFSEGVTRLIGAAIERVKAKGGTVSFDPNIRKEILGLPGLLFGPDSLLLAPSGSGQGRRRALCPARWARHSGNPREPVSRPALSSCRRRRSGGERTQSDDRRRQAGSVSLRSRRPSSLTPGRRHAQSHHRH